MTKTRIVLIRHGESNVTVQRVLGGPRTCSGLSDLGKMQAERLRDRLANTQELQCDVLYSSGYPRAKETAEIIAPALSSLAINIDTRFGEHDPGPECDGLTFAEFVRRPQIGAAIPTPSFSQVARPSPSFINGCTRGWTPLFPSTSVKQWLLPVMVEWWTRFFAEPCALHKLVHLRCTPKTVRLPRLQRFELGTGRYCATTTTRTFMVFRSPQTSISWPT